VWRASRSNRLKNEVVVPIPARLLRLATKSGEATQGPWRPHFFTLTVNLLLGSSLDPQLIIHCLQSLNVLRGCPVFFSLFCSSSRMDA
jgi:hypothetical protein